jgi:hypothetical protein
MHVKRAAYVLLLLVQVSLSLVLSPAADNSAYEKTILSYAITASFYLLPMTAHIAVYTVATLQALSYVFNVSRRLFCSVIVA